MQSDTAHAALWRARFNLLAARMQHCCGIAEAVPDVHPRETSRLRFVVDGMACEACHMPSCPDRLLVHCRVARPGIPLEGLPAALMDDRLLRREMAGSFVLDHENQALIYTSVAPIEGLTAEDLMRGVRIFAARVLGERFGAGRRGG